MAAGLVLGCGLVGAAMAPAVQWVIVEAPKHCVEPVDTETHRRLGAVIVATALVCGAFAWRIGWHAALVPYLLLAPVLVAVSMIDLDHYRIPDVVVFPALAGAVPLIGVVALASGEPRGFWRAIAGAVAYFVVLLILHLVSPAGMGFGDVKLAALLGLFLGWIDVRLVLYGLLLSSLLGTVVGLGVLAVHRSRHRAFPFGPALSAGTVLAVVLARPMLG